MSFSLNFVPRKPFPDFKWKWASLQCTEGLNDPVVLLGVLFRLRKLELMEKRVRYSSDLFADELLSLSRDVEGRGIGVDLAHRTGNRNLMRNSGQYWRALGLIPPSERGGFISLTDFGRQVADRKISQTEFAALTIQTLTLPNPAVMSAKECAQWRSAGLTFRPLLLLLKIIRRLNEYSGDGFLTKRELLNIVVPLSGMAGVRVSEYVNFIRAFRSGSLDVSEWPNCCTAANDHRIGREFLLFLSNYGYLNRCETDGEERFAYNQLLDAEIEELMACSVEGGYEDWIERFRKSDFVSEIERKRVCAERSRPNQARFRREVLGRSPRCIITNVTMPEVLEAAHIVPFKYRGEDTPANGLTMRMDIHQLFDSGHLRIHSNGAVFLTDRARMDYGASIPPNVHFPEGVNLDFVRWRWENYNGI